MVEELSIRELKRPYGWGRLRHESDGEQANDLYKKIVEMIRQERRRSWIFCISRRH
jgi:hypothetical protein